MKKIKVVLHHPANIFTLVESLLTITILNEVVAQYPVLDYYPTLERTINLERLIKDNKDNIYAEKVELDCFYECREIEDSELLAKNFSTKSHELTIN